MTDRRTVTTGLLGLKRLSVALGLEAVPRSSYVGTPHGTGTISPETLDLEFRRITVASRVLGAFVAFLPPEVRVQAI